MTYTRAADPTATSIWRRAGATLLACLLLTFGLVMGGTAPAAAGDLPGDYFVCHATGSATSIAEVKNWVLMTPSDSGEASGHVGPAHQGGLDIIPPIPGVLPEGQNWTEYGQRLHDLGCVLPVAVTVTFTDNTCVDGDYVPPGMDAPTVDGTTRAVTGSVAPGATVTVTYTAKNGYGLVGEGVFTHTFPAQPTGNDDCRTAVPEQPGVTDPCGPDNATWNVPADTATVDWTLRSDGHLVAESLGTKFTDGTTSHDFGIATDSGNRCVLPVPDAPAPDDPCGLGNASWVLPADTESVTWRIVDGDLIADTVGDYEFGNGTTTHNYGQAKDSGAKCVVAVPAQPRPDDPCGLANATWVLPPDTDSVTWRLLGDELVAETTGDYVFGDGTTSHTYGAVEDSEELCPVPLPAEPEPNDPCGSDNASWELPADDGTVTWRVSYGDLIAETTADYVFEDGTTSHDYGQAEDSGAKCVVPVPAPPAPSDPCGLDNAAWVLPADSESVTWRVVDGDLVAETTADYVFDDGTTSHDYGLAEDSATPCQVPVPAAPDVNDRCGLDNATWVQPEDTVSVTWAIVDGDLVATASPSYRFEDGTGTHDYGPAADSGTRCTVPVPAPPAPTDPCGLDNATWPVPGDTAAITWKVVDGELIAETTADYLFDNGDASASYGTAPDSGTPCRDAMATPSTVAATCSTGESLDLDGILNATWGTPTRAEGPGDYSVTATALPGHAFADGGTTATFSGTLAGALSPDDPACVKTITETPSVTLTDECGTAADSGPDFVVENEFWTAAAESDTVVFTARSGWRFPAGEMVSQDGKVWTESFTPNSTELCRDAVASATVAAAGCDTPEALDLSEGEALLNATWGTPTLTEGPGDYSVTATAVPGHAFADGGTSRTFTGTLAAAWDGEAYFEHCAPEQPPSETREATGEKASCKLGGVKSWTDEYTTEYVWDLERKQWVAGDETGPVRVAGEFTPYTFAQLVRFCPPDVAGTDETPPHSLPPHSLPSHPLPEVKGVQASVPTAVDAGFVRPEPWANRRHPLGLVAIGGGLCLMGAAGWRRRSPANR